MIQAMARPPTIYEATKHLILGLSLATVVVLQVLVLETVAPAKAANVSELATKTVWALAVYAALPVLRWVGRTLLNLALYRLVGGETA